MMQMPIPGLHGYPTFPGTRGPMPSSASPGGEPSVPDAAVMARCLAATLDHVGRGMLLVSSGGRVMHANKLARQALGPQHPLQIDAGRLRARTGQDALRLAEALEAAVKRGLRHLLDMGEGAQRVAVAVLPIEGEGGNAALVSLEQPRRAQDLAVQCYARQHGFTGAETAIVEALLAGQQPSAIARAKGVALSTVRTHIGQLRQKTGAHSIRQLLERLTGLPPMMGVFQ